MNWASVVRFGSLVLLVLLTGLSTQAQMMNSPEADSLYAHYKREKIQDYKEAIPVLLELKAYFALDSNFCRESHVTRNLAKCYEASGALDEALKGSSG